MPKLTESAVAIAPRYQFSPLGELIPGVVSWLVSPSTLFPGNRSKDFLDFWHKVRPW